MAAVFAMALAESPRTLPSLDVRWERAGEVDEVVLSNGIVYVSYREGACGLEALSAATGSVLWRAICGDTDDRPKNGPVLLDGRVALAIGDRVLLVDRDDGSRVAEVVAGGFVRELAGPPLVALAGSQLVRI